MSCDLSHPSDTIPTRSRFPVKMERAAASRKAQIAFPTLFLVLRPVLIRWDKRLSSRGSVRVSQALPLRSCTKY